MKWNIPLSKVPYDSGDIGEHFEKALATYLEDSNKKVILTPSGTTGVELLLEAAGSTLGQCL